MRYYSIMLKKISLSTLVFTYLFAGIFHFTKWEYFLSLSPSFLPKSYAYVLVGITGLFEILFSLFLAFPSTRRGACYGIILLWSMALPADLYILFIGGAGIPLPFLELEGMVPFHLLLIGWAWWHVRLEAKGFRSQIQI
jgi:uncharacterized membrane protein